LETPLIYRFSYLNGFCGQTTEPLNLETSVGREKDVQDIGVNREFKKFVFTLLVARTF